MEHPFITKAVTNAQKKIEAMHFDMRKQLLDFDNVLSKQREVIYSLRNKILEGKDITDEIFSWFEDIIDMRIFQYLQILQGGMSQDISSGLKEQQRKNLIQVLRNLCLFQRRKLDNLQPSI